MQGTCCTCHLAQELYKVSLLHVSLQKLQVSQAGVTSFQLNVQVFTLLTHILLNPGRMILNNVGVAAYSCQCMDLLSQRACILAGIEVMASQSKHHPSYWQAGAGTSLLKQQLEGDMHLPMQACMMTHVRDAFCLNLFAECINSTGCWHKQELTCTHCLLVASEHTR